MSTIKKAILAITALLTLSGCSLTESIGLNRIEPKEKEQIEIIDKELTNKLQGRWYYDHLDDEEKSLYNQLYHSLSAWEEVIEFDGVSSSKLVKAFEALQLERPELYYVGPQYEFMYYNNNKEEIYSLTPKYTITESEYKSQMKQIEEIATNIEDNIDSKGLGEYQAELFVHDYLVERVEYYTDDTDTNGFEPFRTIYGALVDRKANCMGYARAMTYLMNRLGIECVSVTGSAQSSDGEYGLHEWNAIKIKDNWYQLDVCWDDPSYMVQDGEMQEDGDNEHIRHTYFNLTDKEMAKTHTLDGKMGELPECESETDNYYVANGYLMESVDEYQEYMNEHFNDMMSTGITTEVRFANNSDYQIAVRNIGDILDTSAQRNGYYGAYMYQGTPDNRSNIISCRLEPRE